MCYRLSGNRLSLFMPYESALLFFCTPPVFTRIPIVGNYTPVCRTSIIFRPWKCTRVIREYSLQVDRWGRLACSADGGGTRVRGCEGGGGGELSDGASSGSVSPCKLELAPELTPLSAVASVGVDALDNEHAACAAALERSRASRIDAHQLYSVPHSGV